MEKLIAQLMPLYFDNDFEGMINKMKEPKNVESVIDIISAAIDEKIEMSDLKREQTKILNDINNNMKLISDTLEIIKNNLKYNNSKNKKRKNKKRKINNDE